MEIRRIAQFVDNFKCGRFLSCNPVRINGIHNCKIAGLTQFTHNSQSVIEIAVNRDNLRAIGKSLN